MEYVRKIMDFMSEHWGLVILLILLLLALVAYRYIKEVIRKYSRLLFGTEDLAAGLRQQKKELSETPKSVSGMDTIYGPMIHRDFPDLNLREFMIQAENDLLAAFNAIEAQDLSLLSNSSPKLIEKTRNIILDLQSRGEHQVYNEVKIHKTVINQYTKSAGVCKIVFQSALEYVTYLLKNDKLQSGDQFYKKQTRYNIEMIYIQDVDALNQSGFLGSAFSTNCPNCGAAVKSLGHKFCEFCGSEVKEINMKVWQIQDYREV